MSHGYGQDQSPLVESINEGPQASRSQAMEVLNDVKDVLSRDWFTRTWTLQEVVLSR